MRAQARIDLMATHTHVQFLPPADALAPFVRGIAVRRRAGVAGGASAQCFPANLYGALTLVHRGELLDLDSQRPLEAMGFSGARTSPAWRGYRDDPEVTTVLFHAGVLEQLLGIPAAVLTNRRVSADEIAPASVCAAWADCVRPEHSVAQQVHALELQLLRWIRGRGLRAAEVGDPMALCRAGGDASNSGSVDALARAMDCSPRHLQRRTLSLWGVSPKQLLRILRMEQGLRSMHRAARSPGFTLAGFARQAGFADGAHLARECRELAGVVPSIVLADLRTAAPHHWAYAPW